MAQVGETQGYDQMTVVERTEPGSTRWRRSRLPVLQRAVGRQLLDYDLLANLVTMLKDHIVTVDGLGWSPCWSRCGGRVRVYRSAKPT